LTKKFCPGGLWVSVPDAVEGPPKKYTGDLFTPIKMLKSTEFPGKSNGKYSCQISLGSFFFSKPVVRPCGEK
jgi:hypothetical protein